MADDNSQSFSPSGWAITFGITSFVLAGTTALSTFMWNKERKKNVATNQASQAGANAAATGNAAGSAAPSASATTGQTAQQNTTQQTRG